MHGSVFLATQDDQGKEYKIGLSDGCDNDLTLDNGALRIASSTAKSKDSACKALIDTRESCLRLEACSDEIYVSPSYCFAGRSGKDDVEQHRWLHLECSTAERRDSIFLQPGDKISLGSKMPVLTVEVVSDIKELSSTNNVQVGSSQPENNFSPEKSIALGASHHLEKADAEPNGVNDNNNAQEVAESMGPADILVDRSTTFTESLLRSTSTPKASVAQSDKIEDTPALDGGRYYDVAAMGTLEPTTATAAGPGTSVTKESERVFVGKQEGEEVKENDGREGTPTFFTPRLSMSTTASPETVAKGMAHEAQTGRLKELSKSPAIVRARTYSHKGRKRSVAEVATDNRMVGAKRLLPDTKVEDAQTNEEQLPEVAESPGVTASSSVIGSKDVQDQPMGNEAAKVVGILPKKSLEKVELAQTAERKQTTPASKRKLSDEESTPKTSRKRSKATEVHEQNNKENELPTKQDHVSTPSLKHIKSHSVHSPSVSREVRSSTAKTASPASKKYRIYHGPDLNIAFSNSSVTSKPSLMRFLQSNKCSVVERISDKGTDVLCIGHGEIKKTSKLLLALAYGKTIITDDWVTRSSRTGNLLDPSDFVSHNQQTQDDSPVSPTTSTSFPLVNGPSRNRKNLLAGKSVYFTPALKKDYSKGFADIQEIVMAVGAKGVVSMPARDITPGPHYIVLALETGDLDAPTLVDKGVVCYGKDLISMSILRGRLDLESEEFRIAMASDVRKKEMRVKKKGSGNLSGRRS